MKKTLLTALLFFGLHSAIAQAPQGFTYQAVIRNASNSLVSSAPVGVRISVLQGSVFGVSLYTETHSANTNSNGLLTLIIGNGTVVNGSFAAINWGDGPYFIQTETDPTGGTNYTITGTTQLMSVPYALYAENSGTPGLQGPQGVPGTDGVDGNDGLSAYQTWLNLGNTGTEADFIASLTGPQGPQGVQGPVGATGPQGPAGNDGAQGLQGIQGPVGPQGSPGLNGTNGLSAYQTWLSLGNTGTEADFIASLTGPQGPVGATGPQGPAGADASYNTVAFKTTMEINRPVNGTMAMVFDSVLFNQGNGWDPIQNIFTAPEQGFYSFSAFLIVGGLSQWGGVYFYVNGDLKGFYYNGFQNEPYMHGTILLQLNQGDVVQPFYQGGSVTLNGHPTIPAYATYFEGFKVN